VDSVTQFVDYTSQWLVRSPEEEAKKEDVDLAPWEIAAREYDRKVLEAGREDPGGEDEPLREREWLEVAMMS